MFVFIPDIFKKFPLNKPYDGSKNFHSYKKLAPVHELLLSLEKSDKLIDFHALFFFSASPSSIWNFCCCI